VLLADRHNILVVSLGFRRRSRELVWKALDHRGKSNLADQQDLLRQALALLPERVRVHVHGDSEFRGWPLFSWLRAQGLHAFLGVQGNTYVGTTAAGPRQLLKDWLVDRNTMVYLQDIYLTEEAYGPVNLIVWWAKDADGTWIVRGVVTTLPATYQTYHWGGRRMWIETVFRDWQSGGFHLDRCGISDRDRVARLLLPLAIAYL
jgi:Transposase DDE domain